MAQEHKDKRTSHISRNPISRYTASKTDSSTRVALLRIR